MAKPPKNKRVVYRSRQGLFDIIVVAGKKYQNSITHRDIMRDLIDYSSKESCLKVWRDEEPVEFAKDKNECEVLYTLALLFFEQELNWGNEDWQRPTFFSPNISNPYSVRPRDMLMGYVCQAFDLGLDGVAYWKNTPPTTTTFTAPDNSNRDYKDYPAKYKKFFLDLKDDQKAKAIMTEDLLQDYKKVADTKPFNPWCYN